MPIGMAMVFRAFPPAERSKASAFVLVPTTVAPASGPVLGGYLLDYWSWEWIFLVNIPIGVAGIVAASLLLREHREPGHSRLDVPGMLLAAGGLGTLLYALANAGPKGFDHPEVVGFGLAGVALLAGLVVFELQTTQPMVEMRLFAGKLFSSCTAVAAMAMAAVSGSLFLLPVLLQSERGLTPLESGLITFPQALGVMSIAAVAARFYPRLGPRRMITFGLALGCAAYFGFTRVGVDTNPWYIRGLVFLTGWSFGIMQVPLQAATFAAVPLHLTGRATAIAACVRQVGSAFGVALAATVLSSRLTAHDARLGDVASPEPAVAAFQDVYYVIAFLTLLSLAIAAVFISDRAAAVSMRATPAIEPAD
jgi:EmrB/QacA subfamily drug resistance transporter